MKLKPAAYNHSQVKSLCQAPRNVFLQLHLSVNMHYQRLTYPLCLSTYPLDSLPVCYHIAFEKQNNFEHIDLIFF